MGMMAPESLSRQRSEGGQGSSPQSPLKMAQSSLEGLEYSNFDSRPGHDAGLAFSKDRRYTDQHAEGQPEESSRITFIEDEKELRRKYQTAVSPPVLDSGMRKPVSPQQRAEEEPTLILDIKVVQDQPEKLLVYEHDSPEEVLDRFCTDYENRHKVSLDQRKRDRLLSALQEKIADN